MAAAELQIREFEPGDEAVFRRLNAEWIVRYFTLEPSDLNTFSDPQHKILDKGGRIFFALHGGTVVGCCALVVLGPGEFEVAKMAVTESAQGAGVGRRVLQHTVEAARKMGAKRLYLETNARLVPAISLYERAGFQRLPDRKSRYDRANVFMELMF